LSPDCRLARRAVRVAPPVAPGDDFLAMSWSRRSFLRASLLGSTGLVAPGGLDVALGAMARGAKQAAPGFGPLVKDPAHLLDLPAGFRYRLLSPGVLDSDRPREQRFASQLTNGEPTPPQHDGMAAFAGPGGASILVRNHELNLGEAPGVDARRALPYDRLAGGGTTTLWVDAERNLVKALPSLSGTLRNCAGGRTPWNSWLSAEEATQTPGKRDHVNAERDPGVEQRHGYIFEVDALSERLVEPIPLKAMGRFRHEAVAVDPATGDAYLTEDREDGLLYRFRPAAVAQGTAPSALRVGDYARGGVLEALRVKDRPRALTSNQARQPVIALGSTHAVEWVRIPEVDPSVDTEYAAGDGETERAAPSSTRAQGFALGCAQFARTEGITFAHGSVYFCCTSGGPRELGQVFRLELQSDHLSLVVQPDDHAILDGPDNICAAPFGDLVVCEDNLSERENFVVGVTSRGTCYRIARNAHPAKREFSGACFSPDGHTLFVNIQQPGMTFAIWGPWENRRS
jgi:secreted PhoX family phosphatase